MPTEQLLVRLQMDAGQYKREANEAATATGKVAQSADQTTTSTGKMQAGLAQIGTVAKVAVAGAATAAVASFAKDTIRAATDLQESINAVNVTFGDAAPAIHAIGETSAESFGLAQSEFNAFAVQFSAFAENIASGSGRQVDEVIGELTGRIADFASVMNIDIPEAAEKFQSGLAGEIEPLRKFGIDVYAAATQQKALELGLAETTAELTEQDKVMARYALIMEQTEKTAGDFKNTQDGLANSTRTVSAQMEDFKAAVGTLATGALAEVASTAGDIVTIFNELGDLLGDDGGAGLFSRIGTAAIDALPGMGAFRDLVGFIADTLSGESDAAAEAALTTQDFADHANSLSGELDALHGVTEDARDATYEYETSVEAARHAEERQATATKAARDAIYAKRDALREVHDPLFAIVGQTQDLAEANDAVAEAEDKYTRDSPEYRDAVIARANILSDLKGTYQDLVSQGIDPTGAAARIMLEDLEVPPEVIDHIFAQFDALEADFENRVFTATFSIPTFNVNQGGGVQRTGESVIRGAHGGIFEPRPGGTFVNLAEAGSREALIPLNGEGIKVLAEALRAAGGGGGSTYNLYGTPEALVAAVARQVALEMRLAS
jgi:hypothetical protein